jgi:hypothetical protein
MDLDLNILNQYSVESSLFTGRIYAENGTRESKNIFMTIRSSDPRSGAGLFQAKSAYIRLMDAMTGNTIWESPALIGSAQNDSLNAVDSNVDGIPEFITLGTTEGMYMTR